jgi:hypothetical protein
MAITLATPEILTGGRAKGGTPFVVTGNTADASGNEVLKAAPGANKSILIDAVVLTTNDADANPHIQDEDDNVLFGLFYGVLGAAGGASVVSMRFPNPIKVATNKALELSAAAAGNVSVYLEGRIQNDPEG